MARIETGLRQRSSRASPRAPGGTIGRRLSRWLKRTLLLTVGILLLLWWVQGVFRRVQAAAAPTRMVTAQETGALEHWQSIRSQQLTLTEGDLTAAFRAATALPTMPFASGQVIIDQGQLEISGPLKQRDWPVTVRATPTIQNGSLHLEIDRLRIGQQTIPRWLHGALALPTLSQTTLITNAALPKIDDLTIGERSVTLSFE